MYCGIGTISLFLAQKAKQVYGVEIVPQAILDARKNAELNDIHNVEFFIGKAEEVVPAIYEKAAMVPMQMSSLSIHQEKAVTRYSLTP